MRVLFVDDEPRVLEGLERALALLVDDDWELEFVESGAIALGRLAEQSFDAIVTDMRMQGIDGAELLVRATELAPGTARIVLSAEMTGDSVVRAMKHAHQLLAKPCSADLLHDVLRSTMRFRDALDGHGLREAVIAVDSLPALPTVYRELEAELACPRVSPMTLARIIARDTGLSARMLQFANSPYFGGRRRIDDLSQAIARLGVEIMSALAIASAFGGHKSESRTLDLAMLAERATRTAAIAGCLARQDGPGAYLAGMLTDVGQLVLATTRPRHYDSAIERACADGLDLAAVEREILGIEHAVVGAYLLALWGLPERVVDAVAAHHVDVVELLDRGAPRITVCTRIASELAAGSAIDPRVLERAGLSRADVDHALEVAA